MVLVEEVEVAVVVLHNLLPVQVMVLQVAVGVIHKILRQVEPVVLVEQVLMVVPEV